MGNIHTRETNDPWFVNVIYLFGDTTELKRRLDAGANIEARNIGYRDTPLVHAAWHRNYDACKLLLERGANIESCDINGNTALCYAIFQANVSVIKLLLAAGARYDIQNTDRYTPLDLAKCGANQKVISLLENHIVAVNLSGVISRGLIKKSLFSDFLVFDNINDPRLFIIVSQFAFY